MCLSTTLKNESYFVGNTMPSQSIPIAESVKALPGRVSTATRELVFLARQLPPLGSKSYFVQPEPSGEDETIEPENKSSISNEVLNSFSCLKSILMTQFSVTESKRRNRRCDWPYQIRNSQRENDSA